MLDFSVRIDDDAGTRVVRVAGALDVHNATEFAHMVQLLSDAVGRRACFDLTALEVADAAGWAAVRSFVRDTEEFGGAVVPPVARSA